MRLHSSLHDRPACLTSVLPNLNVGAVHGADDEGAVEGKLHVAGAAGLRARSGDVLAAPGTGEQGDGVGGSGTDMQVLRVHRTWKTRSGRSNTTLKAHSKHIHQPSTHLSSAAGMMTSASDTL